MLTTLTLVVLVAWNDGSFDSALVEAAHEALGEDASIRIRVVPVLPDEAGLVALASSADGTTSAPLGGASVDAIATITWSDVRQRSRASIALYRRSSQRWLHRQIQFAPGDVVAEQDRTLGFALASLLSESGPDPVTELALAEARISDANGQPAARDDLARSVTGSNASLDATANAGVALDGPGDGFGGTIGTQVDLNARLGLRADLGFRAGHLERIETNTFALDLAPGIAWRVVERPWSEPFAVELRGALAVHYQSVARDTGATSGVEDHARWLPGLRVGAAGLWWFSRQWALLATLALDSTFGEDEILRQGTRVWEFEPFALLMQLGVRARL